MSLCMNDTMCQHKTVLLCQHLVLLLPGTPVGWERQSVPLTVYGIQLLLNFMWTPLFFKLHKLDWASIDILGE